jgi:Ca2+/Na+ antiporter
MAALWTSSPASLAMVAGAALLVAASLAGAGSLAGPALAPGRRALGHWMPIAACALWAVLHRQGNLAIAIIFATSVASLSLVLGSIVLAEGELDAPQPWPRTWLFVLPAGLLPLLAGFAGRLSWIHACIFLLEGAALWLAWQEITGRDGMALPVAQVHADDGAANPGGGGAHGLFRIINVALSAILAVVGASIAMGPATRIGEQFRGGAALVAVATLGPLLVLPMLLTGAKMAHRGQGWIATSTSVGVTLLDLCLLLPAVVLLWYPASAIDIDGRSIRHWHIHPFGEVTPLRFPLTTWRCDTVVLALLGFVLLPVALGRWRLGRAEGVVLIALYAIYIVMETAVGLST